MYTGGYYTLDLFQGLPFSEDLILRGCDGTYLNLSGASGYAPIRSAYGTTGILGQFDVTVTSAVSGRINLYMSNSGTQSLPATQGRYSVEMALSGASLGGFLNGKINIYPNYGTTPSWP